MTQPRRPKKKDDDDSEKRGGGGADEEAVAPDPDPSPGPGPGGEPATNGESIERELAVTLERLEGVTRERDQLLESTTSLEQKLSAATTELAEAQRGLGRLDEVVAQRDALIGERNDLQSQITELQSLIDQRVASAVKTAVEQAQAESGATIATLTTERDKLKQRVIELEAQVEDTGTTSRVTPTVLANRFADMLEQVGAERPTDRPFAAALTSLEVEAKAILEAPKEGEEEPVLRTVERGDVNPEQLSTVRMSFRLLPPTEPPTE